MTHARRRFTLALLSAWMLVAGLPAAARAADQRIIVQRDPGLTAAQRADLRADAGVRLAATLPVRDTEVLSAPGGVDRALARLDRDPRVRLAAPDVAFHVATDDAAWSGQWGLFPTPGVNVEQAWQVTEGAGATVAVVDTGVDATHPDLVGQVRDDGVDYVDHSSTQDQYGHGTEMAGVIAAVANNQQGIAGMAPQARILPLRAFRSTDASFENVLAALAEAGRRGIRVVSASFSTNPDVANPAVAQVLENTLAAYPETLYIVAAGNESADVDSSGAAVYPCDVTSPNLICVGAQDSSDRMALGSNFGPASVDLFAPGHAIYTTWLLHSYVEDSGTSLSTAFVSAEAALLFSAVPRLSAGQAKSLILDTARRGDDFAGRSVTGGVADAGAAVVRAMVDDDRDGTPGVVDNCAGIANPGQADADGDKIGDACDSTARGADADGDGIAALDDRCPTQYARTGDGCPVVATAPQPTPTPPPAVVTPPPVVVTPVVAPRIVSVSVRVAHNRRSARVTVRLSRTLRTTVTVERRVRRHHHRAWKRVLRRAVTFTASGRAMTVRTRVRGSYRVTVSLPGAKTVRRSFRV